MTILVNHVGYKPAASKIAVLGGGEEVDFAVRRIDDGQVAFRGRFQRVRSDFGLYSVGDFSEVQAVGAYVIATEREQSAVFHIRPDAYQHVVDMMIGYFRQQRCGDSQTGYHAPCHLDDGLRGDTRLHQDVSGGWHDACDLRKWVGATIFGMLGLVRQKDFSTAVEEELRWGNRYFLAMQEPAGYLMNYVGGDYFVHGDNNRWTDNVADGRDDRLIDVSPCDTLSQWVFVLAESVLAGRIAGSDPEYSDRCRLAAQRCARWLVREERTRTAGEIGAAIAALLELHRVDSDGQWLPLAIELGSRLLALQVNRPFDSHSTVWGFFWQQAHPDGPPAYEPYRDIWRGCWPLIGLCDLLESQPDHEQAAAWRAGICQFCETYLQAIAARNAFRIVPYGLYRNDPGGGRSLGRFCFRYFYEENPNWYVGNNSLLASTAVGLTKAARLLSRPEWSALAQRQLDWILGCNPFNASTVMGAGYHNPQHMFGWEYDPPTPFIPGAVLNGITGDQNDQPQLRPGSYQECEYWTPMVCYAMWLLAEV